MHDDDDSTAPAPRLPADLGHAHHRLLERLYHAAPTNRLTPARMTIGHGWAQLAMPASDDHLQAVGGVHGMLVFKVLDETGFYAANSLAGDVFLTTADMTLHFVAAPPPDAVAHARAQVVAAGRSSFVVDAWAWTEDAEGARAMHARATGTFVRTSVALPA